MFGPVMIGPSSSHTAGVARIAFAARRLLGTVPRKAVIRFYGSLSSTWRGHGSDKAALAGLLGILPDDERLSWATDLAAREGMAFDIVPMQTSPAHYHANTVVLELESAGSRVRMRGASVGGGEIRIQSIDGFHTDLDGALDAILVLHRDEVGVIATVSGLLAEHGYNIAHISSHRKEKGDEALLVAEVDGSVSLPVVEALGLVSAVRQVVHIPSIRG